ncbi:unnamed protein product [Owenia fusiformis]|uniref:Small ribosomal subunit protein mS33 n=1 Tax=Owenia fusiformis TaxID=6347 RepID=A0A8S4NPS0_OWEFU|nr:unnamed protein product [Owenia fusiformis]
MASNYGTKMARLSARIFGEVARPVNPKSHKVVKLLAAEPLDQVQKVGNRYPEHWNLGQLTSKVRWLGLYRDEHQDFKEEMKRLRALRGKVPPKKGEGKRAMKGKK